jgi:hypothetical protein
MNIIYTPQTTIDALTAGLLLAMECELTNRAYEWVNDPAMVIQHISDCEAKAQDCCVVFLRYEEDTVTPDNAAAYVLARNTRGSVHRLDAIWVTAPRAESLTWETTELAHIRPHVETLFKNRLLHLLRSYLTVTPNDPRALDVIWLTRTPRAFKLAAKSLDIDRYLHTQSAVNRHLIDSAMQQIVTRPITIALKDGTSIEAIVFDSVNELTFYKAARLHEYLNGLCQTWYGYVITEEIPNIGTISTCCIRNTNDEVTIDYRYYRRNYAGFYTITDLSL